MQPSLRQGKGCTGGWTPLSDRQSGKTVFVCVPNLNRRQHLGELAASSPHFDSQKELEQFAARYLQCDTVRRAAGGDFDPDPSGRYAYSE